MNRLDKINERISSRRIGEPPVYVAPFGQDTNEPRCSFWTGDQLLKFAKDNPDQSTALSLGCPKLPRENWCDLGSSWMPDEPDRQALRCAVCEYLIKGDDNHAS